MNQIIDLLAKLAQDAEFQRRMYDFLVGYTLLIFMIMLWIIIVWMWWWEKKNKKKHISDKEKK